MHTDAKLSVGRKQALSTTARAATKQHYIAAFLSRFRMDTCGATAVEYGLLAGLVAIGLAGGLGALSDLVNLLFENVSTETAQVTGNLNDS